MEMLFPAVNCLVETLGNLLRFTCLAVEINSLQMDILRNQRRLELGDPIIDSVRRLECIFRFDAQQAARRICSISGYNPPLYPLQRYPPFTNQEKNPSIAMGTVLCRRKSLNFLRARAKEISGLCRYLCFLQYLFKDFDSICNVLVKRQHLEGSLVELACRIEDVIGGYVFDHSINSKTFNFIGTLVNERPSSVMGEVPVLKEIFTMFDEKNGIQQHLLQTLGKIDLIKRKVKKIYDKAPIVTETPQLGKANAIVDSLQYRAATKKNEVFDIDNDGFVSVLDRVIRIPSALEVVPIVGMGGIGKTTLAQRVFYHPLTCYHFYIRAWVVVSQVHQVRDILIGVLRCIKEITDEIYEKTNGQLAEELWRSLKGKRFLIVLDNIWSTKAWDDVKRCFPDDKNSSRIVLTTRLMKVADYVNNKRPPHYVNLLDADQSWKLLQQMVFGGEEEPYPLEFEDVGKRIARKCQGLPLAIVVVAGILRKIARTIDCWEGIAKSVSSAVSSESEQCLEVLALSYNHLPDHLMTCLLYMGAFPEDCGIEVPKLIHLWIAEGFLDNTLTLTPEDIKLFLEGWDINVRSKFPKSLMELEAKGYLEDLIDRNLVLVGKRSFNGEIRTCRLHDLVQDLCLREAQKAKFMHVVKRDSISFPSSMINQRRLSFHSNILGNSHSVPPMPLVRSFLYFDVAFGNNIPDTLFFKLSFKLLRVLDIVFLRFQNFPLQILKLVQLRYLAFTATFELPISISKLTNLQTLIVYGPWIRRDHDQTYALLLEYWKMPWLRHLHTSVACYLSNPFIARKDLCVSVHECKLQSLSAVTFSSCSEEVFSFMCFVKKLGVVESGEDYRTDDSSKWLSNLVHLKYLEELKCSFYVQNRSPRNRLSWLLPSSLKKLTLSWSYIPWGNMAPIAMLPNLEVLKLKNHAFQGPEWEPSEEGFRCLKHLLIENHDLVHLEATRIHFPRLEHIALRSCRSLEEISFGIAEIPTLQLIELHYCSESAENSAKEIQEQIDGLNVDIRSST